MSADTKVCSKCGEVKLTSCFRKKLDKLTSACSDCLKISTAKYYAGLSDEKKLLLRGKNKSYHEKNKAKRNELTRTRWGKNKEKYSESSKNWREANKQKRVDYFKNYRTKNKEKILSANREYRKRKLVSDPVFALSVRIRSLINVRIYSGGYTKKSRSQEILGCNWAEFKQHIERQFIPGMSWEKLGEIHLDHIVPIATAKTEADVIALNHFSNLRPMWAKENMSKGARITHLI